MTSDKSNTLAILSSSQRSAQQIPSLPFQYTHTLPLPPIQPLTPTQPKKCPQPRLPTSFPRDSSVRYFIITTILPHQERTIYSTLHQACRLLTPGNSISSLSSTENTPSSASAARRESLVRMVVPIVIVVVAVICLSFWFFNHNHRRPGRWAQLVNRRGRARRREHVSSATFPQRESSRSSPGSEIGSRVVGRGWSGNLARVGLLDSEIEKWIVESNAAVGKGGPDDGKGLGRARRRYSSLHKGGRPSSSAAALVYSKAVSRALSRGWLRHRVQAPSPRPSIELLKLPRTSSPNSSPYSQPQLQTQIQPATSKHSPP